MDSVSSLSKLNLLLTITAKEAKAKAVSLHIMEVLGGEEV
jgi:hypothetical protein